MRPFDDGMKASRIPSGRSPARSRCAIPIPPAINGAWRSSQPRSAGELGLPEDRIRGIFLAGLIHDVGKINIPAEILSKPGKLTPLEMQFIRTHPQAGYDIIKGIEFPWPIAEAILQHHERLDGSGYPRGLAAEAVIVEARILAVADVTEAITAHRPYRPALGLDAALAEIETGKGRLYDPAAVDACIALFRNKGFAFQ